MTSSEWSNFQRQQAKYIAIVHSHVQSLDSIRWLVLEEDIKVILDLFSTVAQSVEPLNYTSEPNLLTVFCYEVFFQLHTD